MLNKKKHRLKLFAKIHNIKLPPCFKCDHSPSTKLMKCRSYSECKEWFEWFDVTRNSDRMLFWGEFLRNDR